ncbi:hypothetical protein [Pedobacter lusitanus]|nr:hypothetical protein [Pedobacter lusitanus]
MQNGLMTEMGMAFIVLTKKTGTRVGSADTQNEVIPPDFAKTV